MAQPSVQDWLDSFHAEEAKVWVEDPETNTEKVGGFLGISKQYITFRILLKSLGRDIIGVRHRFSEFEAMRNELKGTFSNYGITVPCMPPKKIIVQAEDRDFIKERTHGLTLFCQSVIASPWLRFDQSWINFMQSSGSSISGSSVGESMLLLSFAQLEPPGNAYARMNEFKAELQVLEKRVVGMIAAAKAMQAAQLELIKANDSVHTVAAEWADVETNNLRMVGGDMGTGGQLLKNPYKVKTTITAFSNFQSKKATANQDTALHTGLLLVVALEHELARIESFRELFSAHDKLYAEIDSLAMKEQKMRGSKDAGRKRDEIAELSKQVFDKRNLLTMFYKGLFHYSIPMNVRQRAASMRQCFNMMAAQHEVSCRDNLLLTSGYFEEMHASPSAAAGEASSVLDLLGLKTLEYSSATEETHSILQPQETATLEMWAEALSKNAKGFNPALHNNASVNSKATSGTYDYVVPAAVSESSPKSERDGYPNRVVSAPRSTSPPPAPVSALPPPAAAPPAPQGSRGAMPGLLGRRSSAPAPAAPTSSTMQEVAEEASYAPSPPLPAPEPAPEPIPEPPAQMKAPSAKTKSLLDDLMGGADAGPAPKNASDSLWD